MSKKKKKQRKQNQNKVNEAKTVENIKYEPILSFSSDFIYRKKLDPLTTSIFAIYFSSLGIIKFAAYHKY